MIVEPGYWDWRGTWREANPDTLALVRAIVDEHPSNAAAYEVAHASPPGATRCVVPTTRQFGIAAQLYALWSEDSGGIGDLRDVEQLAVESGADFVLLSPLHAPRPGLPQEPSPYFPSSRELRNPLHLRVEGIHLANDPREPIDRNAVWTAKMAALGDAPVQDLIDAQLAEVATRANLVHDIAVGFDPAGADAERWRDLLAPGMHFGAPPDALGPDGQDWGAPPFVPERLAAAHFEPLVAALTTAAAHGVGLRIDHVMGLFRLFWIPEGATPADGVYVRYPAAEILDVVAAVSRQHDVFVIGEDLGTVEPGVRHALAARGVLSYKVQRFEDTPPREWPELSLASATTHDLPTIAGSGESVAEVHRELLDANSLLVALTADDLLEVTEQPNRPGVDDPWNWCRRLPQPVSTVAARFVDALAR